MKKSNVTIAHILAVFTIFIWGTTFISTKVLLKDFTPIEILFLRFLIGYIALWIIKPRIFSFKGIRQEILFAGAGLCGVTLYFLLENIALTYTLASNVGIIISVAPMFTAIIAHFLLEGERLHKRFLIGFIMAVIGIGLVSFNGSYVLKLNPTGDILAILAALVWAIYSILMKKISILKYDTIQCTRRVFFYGLIFILPVLPLFDFNIEFSKFYSLTNLFNIIYLGLGASALCFVIWNWVIGILGAIKSSVYIYMVPVVTMIASALILKENITSMAIIGVIFALLGLYISENRVKIKK